MCVEISKYRKMTKKTYTTELSTLTTTRKVKKEKKNKRQDPSISNLIKQSTKMNTGRNFIEEDKNAIKLYAIKIKKKNRFRVKTTKTCNPLFTTRDGRAIMIVQFDLNLSFCF